MARNPQLTPPPGAEPDPQAVGQLVQLVQMMTQLQSQGQGPPDGTGPASQAPPPGPPPPSLSPPPVGGLNAVFAHRFEALQNAVQAAGGDLYIYDGARDQKTQHQMYQGALAKYGGDEKLASQAVAPPGKSNHDPQAGVPHGVGDGSIAADVRGDLHLAHRLAAHYGLVFPSKGQPWHLELALSGAKGGR